MEAVSQGAPVVMRCARPSPERRSKLHFTEEAQLQLYPRHRTIADIHRPPNVLAYTKLPKRRSEFVRYAKANQGQVTVATSCIGVRPHVGRNFQD